MKENVTALVAEIVSALRENEKITLRLALAISEFVKAKAEETGVNAVVALTDAGGNPVSVQCMDDSFIASYDIALNKAFTVVSLKMSTKELKPLAQPGGSLYGIQFTNNGRMVVFGGGVPLYGRDGRVIGGLGVSGGTEEQDTFLADVGGEVFSKCINNLM